MNWQVAFLCIGLQVSFSASLTIHYEGQQRSPLSKDPQGNSDAAGNQKTASSLDEDDAERRSTGSGDEQQASGEYRRSYIATENEKGQENTAISREGQDNLDSDDSDKRGDDLVVPSMSDLDDDQAQDLEDASDIDDSESKKKSHVEARDTDHNDAQKESVQSEDFSGYDVSKKEDVSPLKRSSLGQNKRQRRSAPPQGAKDESDNDDDSVKEKESSLATGHLYQDDQEQRSSLFDGEQTETVNDNPIDGEKSHLEEIDDEDIHLDQRDEIMRRQNLPDMKTIQFKDLAAIKEGSLVESNFGDLTCTMQAKFAACTAEFLPVKGLCSELSSLTAFLNRFFPDVRMLTASSNFIHPDKFDIESFSIERCKGKTLTFTLYSEESMNAAERYLVVNEARLQLTMPYDADTVNLASMTISGNAMTTIDDQRVNVQIVKKVNTTLLEFKMDQMEKISFAGVAKKFNFKIDDIVSPESGPAKEALNLKELSFTKANMKGYLAKGEAFEFLISGTVTNCPLLQESTKTYLIIQKYKTEIGGVKVAIYSHYQKPLLGMLKLLTEDEDLADISLYSKVKEFVFIVASNAFTVINMDPAKELSRRFTSGRFAMDAVNFGVETRFKVPGPSTVIKRDGTTAASDVLVTVNVTENSLRVGFPENLQGNIVSLINTVFNNPNLKAQDIPLPSDVVVRMQSGHIGIKRPRAVNITFMITSTYVVVPDLFSLSGVYFKVIAQGVSPTEFNPWKLGNVQQRETINGTIDITIVEEQGSYCVQGLLDAFSLQEIQTAIKTGFMPASYKLTFKDILALDAKNIKFESPLSKKKADFVRLIGTALFSCAQEIAMDGVFTMNNGRSLAIGFQFFDRKLNDMLELLYGKRVLKTCWLRFVEAGFIFSEKDIPNLKLKNGVLAEVEIRSGVQFIGKMNLKLESCNDEQLCEFIKRFISDTVTTTFMGKMSPTEGYRFTAQFSQTWKLSDNVMMTENRFEISGKDEQSSSTELIGKMTFIKEGIAFEVTLSMTEKGRLYLIGSYEKEWSQPLGYALASMRKISITQDISAYERTKFLSFNGKLFFGEPASKRLKTKVRMIYSLDPEENSFYHGFLGRLSVMQLAQALNIELEHSVLKDITYKTSVGIGYNAGKSKEYIEEFQKNLMPRSLTMMGQVDVLGMETRCVLKDQGRGFFMRCVFPDISFYNGRITAKKGKDTKSPKFLASLKKTSVKAAVKATFSTLGITSENLVEFTPDGGATMEVEGKLMDIIDGKFTLTSKYGAVEKMHFKIEGVLTEHAIAECVDGIKSYVTTLVETATMEKQRMENSRAKARETYSFAGVENEQLKSLLFEIETKVYRRSISMEKAKANIKRSCVNDCRSGCYHGVTWDPKCTKVDDHHYGCVGWSSCSSPAADTPCIAKCEAEKVASSIMAHEENSQIRGLIQDYQDGKVKLEKNEALLAIAKKINNHLKETQVLLDQTLETINTAVNLTSEETQKSLPVVVEDFKVSGEFNQLNFEMFPFQFRVHVAGKTYQMAEDLVVNGHFYLDFGKRIIHAAVPQLDDLEYQQGNLTSRHLKLENLLKEFKDLATKKEDDMSTDIDEEKRDYIPSPVELDFYKIASEHIPQYVVKSEVTTRAFLEDSPWSIASRHEIETGLGSAYYGRQNKSRFTGDECNDVSNVVMEYESLVKGISDIKDTHERNIDGFQSQEKRMLVEANDLDKEILQMGTNMEANEGELADMRYWAGQIREGTSQWIQTNKRHITDQDEKGLALFASQLEAAIRRSNDEGLVEYLASLKKVGTEAVRTKNTRIRRSLPTEKSLHGIHEKMSQLLTSPLSLKDAGAHLTGVKNHIKLVKRSIAHCK